MSNSMYCAYLLRLWRQHTGDPWRVTLIPTAEPDARHHFASLADCCTFLHGQAATADTCADEPLPTGAPTDPTANAVLAQGIVP